MEARLVGSAHQLAFCQANVCPVLRVMLSIGYMAYLVANERLVPIVPKGLARSATFTFRPGTCRDTRLLLNQRSSIQSGPTLARQDLRQVRLVDPDQVGNFKAF